MTSTTALTIIETGDYRLSGISQQINAAVHAAEEHAGHAVAAARNAGQLLLEAKHLVPHGQWESWIAANCTVAPRTAQAYMRLAAKLAALPAQEAQRVADLPLREAIAAIATTGTAPPRTPNYRIKARGKDDRAHRHRDEERRRRGAQRSSLGQQGIRQAAGHRQGAREAAGGNPVAGQIRRAGGGAVMTDPAFHNIEFVTGTMRVMEHADPERITISLISGPQILPFEFLRFLHFVSGIVKSHLGDCRPIIMQSYLHPELHLQVDPAIYGAARWLD